MQTLILEITHTNARKVLQSLEEKQFIKIIDEEFDSIVLPGKILRLQTFKNWIADAEIVPTVSLNTAKSTWQNQRKQLEQLAK